MPVNHTRPRIPLPKNWRSDEDLRAARHEQLGNRGQNAGENQE